MKIRELRPIYLRSRTFDPIYFIDKRLSLIPSDIYGADRSVAPPICPMASALGTYRAML